MESVLGKSFRYLGVSGDRGRNKALHFEGLRSEEILVSGDAPYETPQRSVRHTNFREFTF